MMSANTSLLVAGSECLHAAPSLATTTGALLFDYGRPQRRRELTRFLPKHQR